MEAPIGWGLVVKILSLLMAVPVINSKVEIAILKYLEFKNFPCGPTVVADIYVLSGSYLAL